MMTAIEIAFITGEPVKLSVNFSDDDSWLTKKVTIMKGSVICQK